MIAWVSESDMVASDTGHQVERLGMEDDGSVGEELVAEGMDEAVHEQMLAAQLRALADGEGDEADEYEEISEDERTTGDEED